MDEDDRPAKPKAHEVGMALDTLSIDELEDRIGLLEDEIKRLKQAIGLKTQSKSAADAVFKF